MQTSWQTKFQDAHRERLARFADAAARRPAPVCRTREYRPFTSDVASDAPEKPETPEQWAERKKAIPLPIREYEPWFLIEADITPTPREPKRPNVEKIQRAVAVFYSVTRDDILSARRTANVVRPRQVAMYLAKTLTLRSLPEIGRRFGGRDHTTVLHAVRKIANLIPADVDLAHDVALIEASILEAL